VAGTTEYPGWLADLSDLLDQAVDAGFRAWTMTYPGENAYVAWSLRETPKFQDNVFLCRLLPSASLATRHDGGQPPWWTLQPFHCMPPPLVRVSGNPETVLRELLTWPVDE